MKYIPWFVMLLVMAGCEKTSSPTSSDTQSTTGALYFSFDKANAPAAVKTLTTTLSRSGFTPLVKIIDITIDTAASILFQDIAVGTWKVNVDAKNESGQLLYTGQSEVSVSENSLSQVNLTLIPVATGVGSVQINVTWGVPQPASLWIDYSNNPVLIKSGSSFDVGGVGQPKVFFDNGKYYLYCQNFGSPPSIGSAFSVDGNTWIRPDSHIVMTTNSLSGWNLAGISTGPVFKLNGIYYMMFQGYDGIKIQSGITISGDIKFWMPQPEPILKAAADELYIISCDVEMIDNLLVMYYFVHRRSGDNYIGIAVSVDGLHWERKIDPILTQSQLWETGGVMYPSVVKTDEGYTMLYTNSAYSYADHSFGLATSTDGIHWKKETLNPVFKKENTVHQWASGGIVYPFLTIVNNEMRMYYSGVTKSGEWKIGYAYKK